VQPVEPVEERLREPLGDERDATVAHRLCRTFGERAHRDEPLVAEPRLDDRAGALRVSDGMQMLLDLDEQSELGERFLHRGARCEPVEPGEATGRLVHLAAVGHHVNHRQTVPLADRVVVRVMRGRDLTAPEPNSGST
jgi:hypothetical protein